MREQLEAVNGEVCAVRSLVADPSVPTGPVPEPPPLPAPRTPPPPPSQDLLDIARPLDQEMGDCENEEELEWPPVRRFSHLDRRNKHGVLKGFTKHRHEKRLPASKHVILEDDELTENIGKDHVVQHASREVIGSCTKLSSEYVAAVCAERFCCARSYGCFNSSKFQWVACPDSGAPRHVSLEFHNVGGWVTHGDLALNAGVDFLAVAEHRLIPARVRSEWSRLRGKGLSSIWAPASQDSSHVGNARVGVVSLCGAPLVLPTFATAQFKFFFDCGWYGVASSCCW